MQVLPVQFELIEIQGYLTVAVYLHYFVPGSLKLRTNIQFLNAESFEDTFGVPEAQFVSRRWLPPGESPYPGYCRAPGSSICKPVLCNCEKLTEIWNKIQDAKIALRNSLRANDAAENDKTKLRLMLATIK